MCFTHKKIREKKKLKKSSKIHPEPTYVFTFEEKIYCKGCNQKFLIDDLKIHCAGCNKFFHCKIAGTCYGDNCKKENRNGGIHRLAWCIDCVPKIPQNNEKLNREDPCICLECYP